MLLGLQLPNKRITFSWTKWITFLSKGLQDNNQKINNGKLLTHRTKNYCWLNKRLGTQAPSQDKSKDLGSKR